MLATPLPKTNPGEVFPGLLGPESQSLLQCLRSQSKGVATTHYYYHGVAFTTHTTSLPFGGKQIFLPEMTWTVSKILQGSN